MCVKNFNVIYCIQLLKKKYILCNVIPNAMQQANEYMQYFFKNSYTLEFII